MPRICRSVALPVCLSICCAIAAFADDAKQLKRGGAWNKETQDSPNLKQVREAAEASPTNAVAQNDYGWALRLHGEPAKAEPLLKKAVQLDPKLSYAHSNLSVIEMDLNKTQDALTEGKAAVDLDGTQPIFHVVYGNALLASGDTKGSIAQYQTAIQERADYENAFYNLGRAFQKDGQRNEALASLSKALQLDGGDERVLKLMDELTK